MKKMAAVLAAGAVLAGGADLMAQDRPYRDVSALEQRDTWERDRAEGGEAWTDPLLIVGGISFPTQYFFRGIGQENAGVIAQPWAEVNYQLFQGDRSDYLQSLSLFGGTWNSIHSEKTGAKDGNDVRPWYESDVYMGVRGQMRSRIELAAWYIAYISPSAAFDTVQEIDLSLTYDDRHWWDGDFLGGGFSLRPRVIVAAETKNERDGGSDQGWYGEVGLTPTVMLMRSETWPVKLSVPLTAGFSIDNYYESPKTGKDSTFGYFDVGVVASLPVPFVPRDWRLGYWEVVGGVHFLWMGKGARHLSTVTGNDGFEIIGSLGLTARF